MKKKIFTIIIFFILLITGCTANAVAIYKNTQSTQVVYKSNDKQTQTIKIDELNIEYIINCNSHITPVVSSSGNDDGFNLAFKDVLAWYVPSSDYDIIFYRLIVENIGESYNFGTPDVRIRFDFYEILDDGSEAPLDSYETSIHDWDGGVVEWDSGSSFSCFWFTERHKDERKISQIKVTSEITRPENVPESNPSDNSIIVPVPDPVVVEAKVKNPRGYNVEDAVVVGYTGTEDNLHTACSTNENGEARLFIPPKPPFDEPSTYELFCYKEDEEQWKTTELLMPGDKTFIDFELDVRGRIRTKYLPVIERFPLLQRFLLLFNRFTSLINS